MELKYNLDFLVESNAPTITPAMAQELIDNSRCIKPLNSVDVDRLTRDFINDNFEFNGSTIVLDSDGRLIDGQTRLTACVQSGKSFKSYIVYGIDNNAKYIKDTGRSRNVQQYLTHKGYEYPVALAASAKIIHNMIQLGDDDSKDGIIEYVNSRSSHQEIIDIIESEPRLQECVNRIISNKHRYMTNAIYHLIILDYIHRVHDKEDIANEFLDVLSGIRVEAMDHPVTQLRIMFMNNIQKKTMKMKLTKEVLYMIKAYNHLGDNTRCRLLRIGKSVTRLDLLKSGVNI